MGATGVAAALVGYAHSGTDISSYWQPGLPDYAKLVSVLTAAGGKFGTFIWCQGHNDADTRSGSQYHLTPASTYLAYLRALFDGLATAFPGVSARKILCSIPAIQAAAAAKYSASGIIAIRAAQLEYVSSDPMARYASGIDAGLSPDGIHPSQAGNITFARHFYRAFMKDSRSPSGWRGWSGLDRDRVSKPGKRGHHPASQASSRQEFCVEGRPGEPVQCLSCGPDQQRVFSQQLGFA